MGKPCSYMQFINKKPQFLLQVNKVMCAASDHEIEGSYDEITITIVPRYTGKYSLPLALLLVLCTHNNTDSNKLDICSFELASFLGLPRLHFLIVCSMQKLSKRSITGAGEGLGTRLALYYDDTYT